MDATPVRLGQEFSGYAQQVAYAKQRAQKSIEALRELALGGTAVGTGLNRHVNLPEKMLRHLEQSTGIAFYEGSHFEAQGGKDAVVEVSGHLKTIAVSLFKIANDIRWLERSAMRNRRNPTSGDATGQLHHAWKANPVMCEAVNARCAQK